MCKLIIQFTCCLTPSPEAHIAYIQCSGFGGCAMAQQKYIPKWDTKTSYIDCAQARHLPQTCEPLNCRLWAPVELHHISLTHIHTHTHTLVQSHIMFQECYLESMPCCRCLTEMAAQPFDIGNGSSRLGALLSHAKATSMHCRCQDMLQYVSASTES